MTHIADMKKHLAKIRALRNTLKTKTNMRSIGETRGKIMELYNKMQNKFAASGYTKEAANLMNNAQKLIYG